MDAEKAERSGRSFAVSRAEGFGCVLDQLDAMLVATGLDGGDVRRLTVKMNQHEGLGRPAGLGLLLDDRAGEGGVHVPAALFGVDENGLGAEIGDRRSGGDERQRRAQDFVARADAGQT